MKNLPIGTRSTKCFLGNKVSQLATLSALNLLCLGYTQTAFSADSTHHLLAVTTDQRRLFHSMGTNGDWSNINFKDGLDTSFERIMFVSSVVLPNLDLFALVELGSYDSGGQLHSTVYSTRRSAQTAQWTPFVDAHPSLYEQSRHFPDLTIGPSGTVIEAAIDSGGSIWFRFADKIGWYAEYSPYEEREWNLQADLPEKARTVATAITSDGMTESFHLAAICTNGRAYHIKGTVPTRKTPYPTWQSGGWGELTGLGQTCDFSSLAIAAEGGTLHVVGTGINCQQHARRYSSGGWQHFANIAGQAGDPGVTRYGNAFHDGNQLRVLSVVEDMYSTKDLYHIWESTRLTSGGWTGIMDLNVRQHSQEMFWIARGSASFTPNNNQMPLL